MRAPKFHPAGALAVALAAGLLAAACTLDRTDQPDLDRDREAVVRVVAAKEVLLADLRAGRTSLAAAADAYLALVVTCQRLLDALRAAVPDAGCDLERAARRLTSHALSTTPDTDRPAVAARLGAELRARFPAVTPPPAATAAPAPSPPSPRRAD